MRSSAWVANGACAANGGTLLRTPVWLVRAPPSVRRITTEGSGSQGIRPWWREFTKCYGGESDDYGRYEPVIVEARVEAYLIQKVKCALECGANGRKIGRNEVLHLFGELHERVITPPHLLSRHGWISYWLVGLAEKRFQYCICYLFSISNIKVKLY